MHKPTMPALLLGLAAALAVALIACDRVESQDRTFNLEIEDSKLVGAIRRCKSTRTIMSRLPSLLMSPSPSTCTGTT